MDVGFFACQLHDDPLALRREVLDRNWYIGDWTDHQQNSEERLFMTDRP
jgi:hypothetical protein